MGDDDPYENNGPKPSIPSFNNNINIGTIAPIYGIGSQQIGRSKPDYLDFNQKGRGWMERMFQNVGTAYLTGILTGGTYGFIKGFRNAPNDRMRVKINAILNSCGKSGAGLGNSLGTIALLYMLSEGILHETVDTRYVPNWTVSSICGGVTGAMMRWGNPRGMVGGLVIGAFAMGSLQFFRAKFGGYFKGSSTWFV